MEMFGEGKMAFYVKLTQFIKLHCPLRHSDLTIGNFVDMPDPETSCPSKMTDNHFFFSKTSHLSEDYEKIQMSSTTMGII